MTRLNGHALRQARSRWLPLIAAGLVNCPRCHHKIKPGQPWDLGHVTDLALGGDPRNYPARALTVQPRSWSTTRQPAPPARRAPPTPRAMARVF
jgi:hypothetical protein